jgi:hypothetical protein
MQQGRKSSARRAGLTGSCCREEQATKRGRKTPRKASQGRNVLSACFRFCPGTAYIVRFLLAYSSPRSMLTKPLRYVFELCSGEWRIQSASAKCTKSWSQIDLTARPRPVAV